MVVKKTKQEEALERNQQAFIKSAWWAIKLTKDNEELISPFSFVLHSEQVPYRPFLYEDEKCVVLVCNDIPAAYYFRVIPRKPITRPGKAILEESHNLLRQHLVCVAKNLANVYGIADLIKIENEYGYPGARFCLHFNILVSNKNGADVDPASVNFENSIPSATNLEVANQLEELRNAFEEYDIMDEKYRKFFFDYLDEEYEPAEDWREPEDAEMREVLKMEILRQMFPYTFIRDQPFSYFVENLPHFILEVEKLEENLYQTSPHPIAYRNKVFTKTMEIKKMYREKYHLPGHMAPNGWGAFFHGLLCIPFKMVFP